MLSRRDLVGKLAVGAAGVVALAASGVQAKAAVGTRAIEGRLRRNDEPLDDEVSMVAEIVQPEAAAEVEAPPAIAASSPPWELLKPLTLGSSVAYGWRIADFTGVIGGACVLTLRNERGRVQRVHICRNDGQPQGFVYTRKLDLVVMNGGRGDLGTEENLAQAVAAVAHVVAANEGRVDHAVFGALLPHTQRLRQYSAASEWTLR
jgi:hypothetical protein